VTEEEILKRLSYADPSMRLLPSKKGVIDCDLYSHCMKVMRATFYKREIFIIQLEKEKYAEKLAKSNGSLYFGNWAVDNIQREKQVVQMIEKSFHTPLHIINMASQ
jgi:hypothetical protein